MCPGIKKQGGGGEDVVDSCRVCPMHEVLMDRVNAHNKTLYNSPDGHVFQVQSNTDFRKGVTKALWIIGTPLLIMFGTGMFYIISTLQTIADVVK